ncbi:MAG: rubrerythrin family protein [Thermoanaerobaculaceae bacterium]|nr:rubrerythrin family protein [Thermoanaerobaculaceae bacterium]
MATTDNLRAAFAGESQANRTYLAFAKKADADGFKQIAKLFRAAAEAETVHALAHFRVLGGVASTQANLEAAIAGEAHEAREMYPAFLAEAEREGNKGAVVSFRNALAVEKVHHALYSGALAAFREGRDLKGDRIWICPVCGNTVVGEEPPAACDVCGVPGDKFSEVR